MQDIFDELYNKINEAVNSQDFEASKDSILADIHLLKQQNEVIQFKFNRLIKDKNVLHSLLARTSDDLKLALNELSRRAEELNTLLFAIPALVYFKDVKLNYVIVNKAFEEFCGLKTEEIIGRSASQVFAEYKSIGYDHVERQVVESGIPVYHIEEKITDKGRNFILSTNLAPVKNSLGENIGLVGVSWDVTKQYEFQAALLKAKEAAEAGTKAKSEFLANMSHEIRTPLNGIIGMSQILGKSIKDPKNHEHLDIIIASGQSLLALVNDILDFSKIEAGLLGFEESDFNFREIIREAEQVLRVKAQEKALSFVVNVNPGIPEYLKGDAYRLKQVWLNLANNAIKFTEKGSVTIDSYILEDRGDELLIMTRVKDSGIGISNDQVSRLFKSFEQLDASHTRKYGGTGLGLAISKKLVSMMQGQIGVESEPGVGSTFWFTARLKKTIHVHKPINNVKTIDKETLGHKLNVLLAEDNLINQKVASFSLEQMGFLVTVAGNGRQAIEKFRSGHYDLILMDVQMPEMNGFEATREIRSIENTNGTNKRIPIIALTANAMKGDMEKCIASGMDAYLSKPFQQKDLHELITHYFTE
ncbi:MAG: response regulator [Bacteroidetes bacterium]|nr:response regulator [Bacteroidota bacterium]